jgi:hypothetical protein
MYGFKFNTLVVDCEGCLCEFLNENPKFIEQLHTIFFEKDYKEKCDYLKIVRKLKKHEFYPIVTDWQHELWRRKHKKTKVVAAGRRKTKRIKH